MSRLPWIGLLAAIFLAILAPRRIAAQNVATSAAKDYSKESFVVERTSARVKFENDGTNTLESRTRVRIQSASGVQNWGVIQLPYAASTGDAEIQNVKVIKPGGAIVTTPLESVQDVPQQVTIAAPFYSDLNEKELAVKGLEVGDVLEFDLIVHTRAPLIPGQFWYDHAFFVEGIVLDNELQISVPAGRKVTVRSPKFPFTERDDSGYHTYSWKTQNLEIARDSTATTGSKPSEKTDGPAHFADVELTSFRSWDELADWYRQLANSRIAVTPEIRSKADDLTRGKTSDDEKIRALYDYVSTKFRYIGVALGIGRYLPHPAGEVLANGYGDCKDKHTLLAALLAASGIKAFPALISSGRKIEQDIPSPSHFDHMITAVPRGKELLWLDTTPEVAPFGLLTANLRDNQALVIPESGPAQLIKTPADPPFQTHFRFHMKGKFSEEGTLVGDVEVSIRGDLEIPVRSAFRQSSQGQWKDIVQSIARAWNFAGTVSEVTVGSPDDISSPFTFKYTYTRKDYPNWPDAMRQPLPPIGLPPLPDDQPATSEPISLGAPGEFELEAILELPVTLAAGVRMPVNVKQDFAEYHSAVAIVPNSNVLRGQHRLIILKGRIPQSRRDEYQAFTKAVNEDDESLTSLTRAAAPQKKPNSGVPNASTGAEHAEQLVYIGDALFSQDDLDGAIAKYRQALELNPENRLAHRSMGDALLNRREYRGATDQYKEALRIGPDDPLVHHALGEILDYQNDEDGAIAEYRKALELKPDYVEARSDIGVALSKKHDLEGALAEFRAALKIDPKYAEAHNGIAATLLDKNDLEGAGNEYREAIRLKPDLGNAHAGLGSILLRKDDLDGSSREFQEAIRLDPKDSFSHMMLGHALISQGKSDQGIAELQKAVELSPGDVQKSAALVEGYMRLGRVDEAIGVWRQVAAQNPDLATLNIGRIFIQAKRYPEAIKELQPALDKNPRAIQLAFALGMAFARSGNGDAAFDSFLRALGPSPTADQLNSIGYELADDNVRLDDALHFSEQAVEKMEADTFLIDLKSLEPADLRKIPALAAFWDTLGWAHFRLRHMDTAEKYLSASWNLAQDAVVGDHLAQLYEKTGNRQKAIEYYALAINAGHAPQNSFDRLAALLGSKSKSDEAVRSTLGLLSERRTVKLHRSAAAERSEAEFFVLLQAKNPPEIKFAGGSEALRGMAKPLGSASYPVSFPDDRAEKILRRGILDCPAGGAECRFVLLPPENVTSIQ